MLSKKTRYAILALVRLAKESGKGAILISDIAESEHLPQRFLELILVELKKLGIVGSKLGKSGGYYLIKEPAEVTLWAIVRHFEGPIALVACVSEKAYQPCEFCKDEAKCNLRSVFKEIRDNTYSILKKTTLKDLI
jgi:Rrf2 family protein